MFKAETCQAETCHILLFTEIHGLFQDARNKAFCSLCVSKCILLITPFANENQYFYDQILIFMS